MWGEGLAGLTTPHALAKWFAKVGFTGVFNDTNIYFSNNYLLRCNARTYTQQYVCLFINDNMVDLNDPEADKSSSKFCNHWVVLQNLV